LSSGAPAAKFATPDAYTPKHLAEKILTSKAALEGERKQVTVLFADLKGSMELLADRDPEEARKLLDPVLERMMEAVHRYEGTVNQVMGDGIMALFGAPLAHEDHAVRACYSALRMQELVKRYAEEARHAHGVNVQIRVGLNSGEVVVRAIGSDLHMDYTAVGQTTHLAARMEQFASPGSILLTSATLELVEGQVAVTPLGPVPVKGLAAPVEVYEVTGAGPARTRLQAARARGFSKFVGRDAEMEQVRRSAEQARSGRGQLVAVVGEAGVGKSRLFYEFIHSHHTQGWLVLEASSVSYGKATPFLPLADLLRAYFRIDDRDDARGVRAKVTGTVLTLDRAFEDTVPAVLWVLDALAADDPFLAAEPAQRRRHAVESVKRLLLRESRVQPLLLVFEDLHWVDAETQAVLDSLVESLPTAPVLLATNYRPEYRHGWNNKTYYRQLRVDPLPPTSADELLDTLLGHDGSVASLKALLITRTEGNPLFLEESVRTLAETGALRGQPGAYALADDAASIQVPATVQAILTARIDRLRPDWKRLLQAAAVIGKDVPMPILSAIADTKDDELQRALAELQTAELLYEARLFPELEHALTHEVAYGSVLQDRRRALHAGIVDAIERLHANRLTPHVEVLAHHAVRGGIASKAVRYLREAGAKAVARSANREAVEFFQRALTLLAELPETPATLSEELDIRIPLGTALMLVHGAPAPMVEECYLKALAIVDRLRDESRRFLVLWGLWYVRFTRGDYPLAIEAGEQLLVVASDGDDVVQLLEAHHAMWPTLVVMGEPSAALPHIERGIELYDPERHGSISYLYGGHDPGACCRNYLALAQWLLGQPDRALTTVHEVTRLADRLGHPMTQVITLWVAALIQYERGERAAALHAGERAMALIDAHGFAAWHVDTALLVHAARGDRLDVSNLDELRRRAASARNTRWRHGVSHRVLAGMYADIGQPEQGLALMRALRERGNEGYYAPEIHRMEGELILQATPGAIDEAERAFRAAIEDAQRRKETSLELRAATSLARLWRENGKADEARAMLAPLYARFSEGLATADLVAAKALLVTG
jgi:class 3 adenylate cyclase/tetratricopeptide (TPR) repeat protein